MSSPGKLMLSKISLEPVLGPQTKPPSRFFLKFRLIEPQALGLLIASRSQGSFYLQFR